MPEISGGVLDDELGERVRRRMEEKRHSKEEIQNKLTQIKEPEEEVEN
ncbi:MAG: hypothetical protein LBO09_05640 [Candidatus Peribacteria bacterium]|jgi:hypothetical protein|nr:hypothetical protein [Candidatus Peribacteria bacterium]